MGLVLHVFRTHIHTYKHIHTGVLHINTNSLKYSLLNISCLLYLAHFTCLYLDPADESRVVVWLVYLSLGNFQQTHFHSAFARFFFPPGFQSPFKSSLSVMQKKNKVLPNQSYKQA
ncbi:hypothetical protein AMECASPLE_007184 [Ameca splendens]|uniref:Uncharacterized protein n=1 Tax=Ameca splendens TaxID=208324 RepID=A0ABV0ZKD3_9TELE